MEDFYFISYLIRNFDIKKNKTKGVFDKNIDLLYKNIENRENSLDLYFLWLTSPEPFIFKIFLDLKNNFISKLTNKHYRQIKKSFAKRIIYRLLNTSEIVILKNLERQVNLDEIVKKELTELEPDLDKRIKKRKMEIDLKTKKTILKVEKYDKQKQKEIQEMIREKRRLELLMQQQDNYWQDY
jgi:superfamily II helicase